MKTTIKNLILAVIVFMASFAHAQFDNIYTLQLDYSLDSSMIYYEENLPGVIYIETIDNYTPADMSNNFSDLLIDRLLDDYDKYLTECYNDSIQSRVHDRGNDEYCIVDWECLVEEHWHIIWVHRDPTFQGFMEYLRTNN